MRSFVVIGTTICPLAGSAESGVRAVASTSPDQAVDGGLHRGRALLPVGVAGPHQLTDQARVQREELSEHHPERFRRPLEIRENA